MSYNYPLFIFFALYSLLGFSQDMQKGFTYLETGQYQNAETFFEGILTDHPKNKTAKLCYGRAIGLNGKAQEAVVIFTQLRTEYPTDFEVKLNYAESLLWNNEFAKAKTFYQNLVIEDPKSFSGLLGYANTLSNLKEYPEALAYVNKALVVSPGNPNALTSRKFMYLGYAYQKQQAQDYSGAEAILKEGLKLYKGDKDMLQNLANLYLIASNLEKAKATYDTLAKNPSHKISALNGLALVSHLDGKEKDALKTSQQAYSSIDSTTNIKLMQQTQERHAQALIWNKKYKKATTLIDNLLSENPNKNWTLALRATLNVYKSDFKNSLKDYQQILVNDSSSFDGNLGQANVLKALGKYTAAYASAEKTLAFYTKQKDATNFITQLDKSFTPFVETNAVFSYDNGDNEAYSYSASLVFPMSPKLKLNGQYAYRDSKNTITGNQAKANNLLGGVSYALKPNMVLKTNFGLTDVNTQNNDYTQFLTDIGLSTKPFKRQTLDVGYKREWQNFNADLISQEIDQNTLYTNYNLSTNVKLGWYTQYNYSWQNDNNTKHLLFTSLYYNVFSKPACKFGVNFQYITFKDQVPSIYFSPEKFKVYEVFVDLIKNQKGKLSYNLNAATGFQFIENQEKQSTYRLQGKIGYTFNPRFSANVYGLHSNIASATAAGFTYTELGFRLQWFLFKKPLFRKAL